ncbi:MAG TPA: 50S ribosomal protein L10 [Actinomycetota bacterium]|nr:50S ribosomal protein L10 [Actinomycetota bacterium]
MPRAEKEQKVREIAERLRDANAAVITDYRGLTVKDAAELRASLDEVETRLSVVKNTLTKLAVKEAGLEDGLSDLIDGPTAIAFVRGDPVAGVKRLVEATRRLRMLEVRGGFAEGRVLSADEVRDLAALESREVMLAKVAGLAKMQLSRTAWLLQALQARFVGVMEALREKLPEMPEAPGGAEPAETETEPAETETEPEAPGEAEPPAEPEETEPPAEPGETEPSREPVPAAEETEPAPATGANEGGGS